MIPFDIDEFAGEYDAFVVWRDGDAAVMYRHYDYHDEVRVVPRHQPDNCDYHSPEAWQEADEATRVGWIV